MLSACLFRNVNTSACRNRRKLADILPCNRCTDGVAPNSRVLTAALTVCAVRGQWQLALQLLDSAETRYGVSPTVESYNAAVHACDKGGAWHEAVALLRRMPVAPSVNTYNTVMSACSR